MKKKYVYIINIVIPIIILIGSLIHFEVAPFGKYSIGICDAITQFKPMLFDFVTKLKLGIFSVYSFNNGFGNPIIFNIMYYLNSPINIIAILFNNSDSMFFAVILIKMIIASLAMTFYTYTKTDRSDVVVISTLSYVFSSWFLIYYYNFFWLDLFMIFPIFQYGLELILEDKKPFIYILSLGYMIFSNFFLIPNKTRPIKCDLKK